MKSEILTALRESNGYVSGQDLCEKLGVSRTAVWKGINKLKEAGYQIEAVPKVGYRLLDIPDILSTDELLSIQKTNWIGKEVRYYDVTDSTNTQAKRLAEEGSGHGTLVVAGRQESGKGRRGKNWESPIGTGIFMTLLLKPEFKPNDASMMTLVAAMAVSKALREDYEIPAQIKWPNDIVLNGRKICGILTEMSAEIDYINYVVVGIGINVSDKSFHEEIIHRATSIFMETGRYIKRSSLIESIWERFEEYYEIFLKTCDLSGVYKEYNKFLVNMHEQVRVLDPKEPFEGKAMGITETGELIVDCWDSRRLVSGGEVSVRGVYGYV